MVASIVNASHNASGDITSGDNTFTKSQIDAISDFSGTTSDLVTGLSGIESSLPTAMVTTYTYTPLAGSTNLPVFGITSRTEPNGIATYYDYDSFGRLSQISDNNHKLLKKYTYNLSNQGASE